MMKQFHVLYNQDCTNLFAVTKEPLTPEHVDRMVDEVANGGADVMLINPNAQRVNYPSRVWQTFWDGYAPGRHKFFGAVPDAERPGREAWVRQMKRLADQGCDYLARALARCRQQGIAAGITLRMNDMHDAPTPGTNLHSRFYMEHPRLRLRNPPACGWSATGLNYRHAAVRRHVLTLIRELAGSYDFDVLELDFLRFHSYFPRGDFARHCAIMTGFMREVRTLLASSGCRTALMARLPVTPAAACELGFDVATWAREKLVDGISAGAFLATQWDIPVDEYRALTGDAVPIYACTDMTADRRDGLPVRALPTEPLFLRGFAAGHLAAGAHGVELFNFFCTREEQPPCDPCFSALEEMGSLEFLRGRPKSYTVMSGWMVAETDGAVQVPVGLAAGQSRRFQLLLAAEPDTVRIEADILCAGSGNVKAEDLWLQVNHTPVGPARAVGRGPGADGRSATAVFAIPATAVRDGRNILMLRNEGAPLNVLSLQVRVTDVRASAQAGKRRSGRVSRAPRKGRRCP